MPPSDLLDGLNNRPISQFHLRVRDFVPSRFANQRHFELFLCDEHDHQSARPVFRGTFSAARPAIFVPGWIDGELMEQTEFNGERVKLWDEACLQGTALELAAALGSAIPSGGRLWLAYEQFGQEGRSLVETREGLGARVPILATPMGYLLYHADCWLGPRDWDIPEGGREGPRKVQGNKALDTQHEREGAAKVREQLASYLKSRDRGELHTRARARAERILRDLDNRLK